MRVVSPPRSAKRARTNEDASARRVLQRTEDDTTQQVFVFLPSMSKIVKKLIGSSDQAILASTMSELVRLLYRKDGNNRPNMQEAFFNAGGHLAVVTAMAKHPSYRHLQHEGIRALTNATCDNKKLKIVVAEIGGIQATVEAMTRHPLDRETQRLCLKALNNLVYKKEHANLFVNEIGGCSHIVRAMNKFPGDVDVIQKASVVLLKLSSMRSLRPAMVDAGAISALTFAVERHVTDEKIQNYAGDIIVALT